jgi:hypothetical protein
MTKINNKNARQYVERLESFEGSNLSAKMECKKWYVVRSYQWYPIFAYDCGAKQWYENIDRYSSSTSRQQVHCRPEGKIQGLSKDAMDAFLKVGTK